MSQDKEQCCQPFKAQYGPKTASCVSQALCPKTRSNVVNLLKRNMVPRQHPACPKRYVPRQGAMLSTFQSAIWSQDKQCCQRSLESMPFPQEQLLCARVYTSLCTCMCAYVDSKAGKRVFTRSCGCANSQHRRTWTLSTASSLCSPWLIDSERLLVSSKPRPVFLRLRRCPYACQTSWLLAVALGLFSSEFLR